MLAETGQKEVFIDLDEEIKYEKYLENNLGTILENQGMPDDQKAEVFSRVSTNVSRDSFETSGSRHNAAGFAAADPALVTFPHVHSRVVSLTPGEISATTTRPTSMPPRCCGSRWPS
jgi:hypothetical protein